MQEKNVLISFLQIFGILLVVIGHGAIGAPARPLWQEWIYSFHMPLFMFISGFLLRYSNEHKGISLVDMSSQAQKMFVWKKVKRLLIPYVVISTMAFFPKSILSRFSLRPLEFSFSSYIHMLLYPWDNVIIFFWFLPTLFIIFLIILCSVRLFKSCNGPIGYMFCLFGLLLLHLFNPLKTCFFLNIGGVIDYMFYFCLGFFSCYYHVNEKLTRHFLWSKICLSSLLSIAFVCFIPEFVGKDVLSAVNGIILSLLLGKLYVRKQWTFLHHLFGASYAIYLFSWFPQVASQQLFLGVTHAPWQVGSILAIFTGVYVPLWLYKWIIRHKKKGIGKAIAFLTGQ